MEPEPPGAFLGRCCLLRLLLQPLQTCPGSSSCCWHCRAQSTAWEPLAASSASSAPGQHIPGWSRSWGCSNAQGMQQCRGGWSRSWGCSGAQGLQRCWGMLLAGCCSPAAHTSLSLSSPRAFPPPLLTPKPGLSLCRTHLFLFLSLCPVLYSPQCITAGIGCI